MPSFNGTLMQFFHSYIPSDGSLWEQLSETAADLAKAGFSALWLPPACKASTGATAIGYDLYDLFDLGEFDQKSTVRTKYGTRDQFLSAIDAAHRAGLQVYADAVLSHKVGGDTTEEVDAIPVAADNRNYEVGSAQTIKIQSYFSFPGRGETYSSMQWHWWHFDAVNHNAFDPSDRQIFRLKNKHFDTDFDPRHGQADFLNACDLDMDEPQVNQELVHWGQWFLETTKVDGFRLEAIKHIRAGFFRHWLEAIGHPAQHNLFVVGDYWTADVHALHWYIAKTSGQIHLFDAPLHYNFHRASRQGSHFDMRTLMNNTLIQQQPTLAVTFVENHNSQPLQMFESEVAAWFKPLAYAFILLRQEGYPCVFYADYYGAHYSDKRANGKEHEIWLSSHRWLLDKFLQARRHYAFGEQYDYLDHPNLIGWTRLGTAEHPKGLAVLMSNGPGGSKWMDCGKAKTQYRDVTQHVKTPVWTNEHGWGEFHCRGGSVSVWVEVGDSQGTS
jgi:alpha-amylase